jgi:hypothetical protein
MATMETSDLMDQLAAVLPRVDPAVEAGAILAVMARICRAPSAAVFFERGGVLQWLAGERLPERDAAAISSLWRSQRRRVLTGTAFTESVATAGEGPVRSRMMWMRRPHDGGLDAVYFSGPDLRPLDGCSSRLIRLAALLARLH